jgi:hypothetical protein
MKSAYRGRSLARLCGFVDVFVYTSHTPADLRLTLRRKRKKTPKLLGNKEQDTGQAKSSLCPVCIVVSVGLKVLELVARVFRFG